MISCYAHKVRQKYCAKGSRKTDFHPLEKKVCRNTRCAFFFFIDYKNRLIFSSCDILRISLVYVFATSK